MMMMSASSFASDAMDEFRPSNSTNARRAFLQANGTVPNGGTVSTAQTQQQYQASQNYLTSPFKGNKLSSGSASTSPLELMQHPLNLTDEERSFQLINKRVGLLAGHMTHQLCQHQQALRNTKMIFNQLLEDLPTLCTTFKDAFKGADGVDTGRIFNEIDPDKSVGVLNILWHCLSFTSRGNSKPLALFRPDKDPVFTGRILAIRGDFLDISHTYDTQQFSDLLSFELASLYIPSDPLEPAIMRIPHLGEEEQLLNQGDAARLFLLKTIEMVCGGGFLHEQ
ncbi:MAG: hypothetical protein H2174_08650 [Vampirovibrio sp.]|jgi:hypothetical protein|nr:hypothetical protein [Vampirovibrio sp.]